MSAAAEPLEHIVPDDNLARRNAMVLSAAQALAGGNNTVIVSTASIVGAVLAPDKGLATLPVTAMVFGMWLGTLPLGVLARKFGRRFALQCGSAFGILSGLISYSAVMNGNFWLLLFGTFCGGLYAAAHQSYRFAAADTASDAYRPKVVSWVLAGGVFAAVLGPQLVIFTKDLLTAPSFCGQLSRPIGLCGGSGVRAAVRQSAAACRSPPRQREAAWRDRAECTFHRRGRLRNRKLRHDEYAYDVSARWRWSAAAIR